MVMLKKLYAALTNKKADPQVDALAEMIVQKLKEKPECVFNSPDSTQVRDIRRAVAKKCRTNGKTARFRFDSTRRYWIVTLS